MPIAGAGYVNLYGRDITDRKRAEAQLRYQARHDALTGLVNRREFEARLRDALQRAVDINERHALLYIDLDQFKLVNDTCGHTAGDELLRQLSARIRHRVRSEDTLARLGGDEFGVLLERCDLEHAKQIAGSLHDAIREYRFAWKDNVFETGASIGIVQISSASSDIASLMSAADIACYAAKDLGRNRIHVYQPDDAELAQRHGEMHWVSKINRAFENDRFVLFAQKIVSLQATGCTEFSFEILLRMIADDGSHIPPGAFIPAAERYGLMPAVDRWVMERALERLHRIESLQRDPALRSVSLNLSGASLGDPTLKDHIRAQLATYHIPPQCICFEITETTAITNLAEAARFISDLRQLGCRFSLDDFGSGLSSFTYLKQLPADILKIDGSFVRDMVNDPIDAAMVKAISQIGKVMGIHTVAEFVEDAQTLEALKSLDVDYAQGYYLDRPRPVDELIGEMPEARPARQGRVATH